MAHELELIRFSEASRITGLHHHTLRNYVKAGKLSGYKIGNLHKVDRAEVLALITQTSEVVTA